ncbi:MAG: type II secretion system F family protein [Holosporales bacterium]|nr:type II secretion system F family protein [Holosporales bacterium]
MPTYFYKAIDKTGKLITGNIDVLKKEDVDARIQSKGLTLIKIEKTSNLKWSANPVILVLFFKQLSILLNQHITLIDALEIMGTIETKRSVQKFLNETLSSIKSGNSFAKALSSFPQVATPYVIGSLERAEQTGNMGKACEMLSQNFEAQEFLKKQMRKALTYPTCVFVAILGVVVMMLRLVIPNVRSIIQDDGGLIFALSDLSVNHPHMCISVMLSFVIAGFVAWRKIRSKFSTGSNYNSILWLNSVAILLQSGIPLKDALLLSNSQTKSKELKAAIAEVTQNVVNGEPFHNELQRVRCVPRSAAKFAEIGNACGLLGDMLAQCASIEMQRLFGKMQQRIALLQPILLGAFGLLLIVLISAILSPLYDNLPML